MDTRRFISHLVTLTQHSIGVGVIFAGTLWVHGSEAAREAAAAAWTHGVFFENATELALQIGLSACLWALVAIAWRLVQIARDDMKDAAKEPKRVVLKARGTVLTETLIVFPVFLLLTMGLIQLTLNNTAAIFTSLAAFQAGRTAQLWVPELNDSVLARNGGVSADTIRDKTRIAAASVLAPVASSEYLDGVCSTSPEFNNKLEAMMSVTIGAAGSLGNASADTVRGLAGGKQASTMNNLTVAKAFDSDMFAVRAPVKLLLAYCHTSTTVQTVGGFHNVEVVFDMKQTMPLVGPLFGQIVKSTGRYKDVTRTYTIPQQIPPNPAHPLSLFSITNFNPFARWR